MHSKFWHAGWVVGLALCAAPLCAEEKASAEAAVAVEAPSVEKASFLQEPAPSAAPVQIVTSDPAPAWYVGGEALFIARDRPQTRIVTTVNATGATALTTQSADFNYEPGMRFTVGRELSDDQVLEFVYSGVTNMNGSASVAGAPNQFGTGFTTGGGVLFFNLAEGATIDVSTDLHSFELNNLRVLTPTLSLISGIRYFRLEDQFTYTAFNTAPPPPVVNAFARYYVETENDMLGYQIGGLMNQPIGSRINVGLKAKAGLFANIQEAQTVVDRFNTGIGLIPLASARDHDEGLATVIDLGFSTQFRITDGLFVRAGYELSIVSGVALAGDQLGFRQAGTVDNGGYLVADGASVGLIWIR